jgi:hypothetical protein
MILQAGILTLVFGAVCLLLGTQLREIFEVIKEVSHGEDD